MTAALTRQEARAAVQAASTERDAIQANLLELDDSFGKRMLAGAPLTGATGGQWAAAEAELAALWQTFNACSAVVDQAGQLADSLGWSTGRKIEKINALLSGLSVQVTLPSPPIGQRELTAGPGAPVSLTAAVGQMKRSYSRVSMVCAAAETVWNALADGLQQAATDLALAQRSAAGIADDELAGLTATAGATLGELRGALNSDPLSLWQHGTADTSRLDRLRRQVAAVSTRAAELSKLHDDTAGRIAAVTAAVTAAASARQDAEVARQRAAAKVSLTSALPPLPDLAPLAGRLATLDGLRAGGRWSRLATELDTLRRQAAQATERCRDAERAATAQLDRREELRGLLEAYQAKAARLGAADDAPLGQLYRQARDLLWTAPCDTTAAAAAVASYQRAVLALGAQGRRA
ncbi:MAG TPA: hypothetical protein VGI64_20700 [Streptosporangiaceae bacterium]|jgi:hypothetical protein